MQVIKDYIAKGLYLQYSNINELRIEQDILLEELNGQVLCIKILNLSNS